MKQLHAAELDGLLDARSLPGPGRLSALRFFPRRSFATTLTFLEQTARAYGEIAHFTVLFDDYFLLDDADLVRDVFVTRQHDFVKSRGAAVLRRVLGEGLLTSEEPLHRTHRRLVQPAFSSDRVAAYGSVMTGHALRLSAQWQSGESLDIAVEMQRLALGIVGDRMYGADLAAEKD